MKVTLSASQEKMETAISITQEGLWAMLNESHQETIAVISAGQENRGYSRCPSKNDGSSKHLGPSALRYKSQGGSS
jgi:hypothetical protein